MSIEIVRTAAGLATHLRNRRAPDRTMCGKQAGEAMPLDRGVYCRTCERHLTRRDRDLISTARTTNAK